MEIRIISESSKLAKNTYRIATTVTIGEESTQTAECYDKHWLMEHRMLTGTIEERVEQMRLAAEKVTTKAIENHFKRRAAATSEPIITDVSDVPSSELQGMKADILIVDDLKDKPKAKKTPAVRKPRTTKPKSE